jgi:hypothetical protein
MKPVACTLVAVMSLWMVPMAGNGSAQEIRTGSPLGLKLHAGAVVPLIQQLGGQRIQVVNASLIAVLNRQAFLVEPAGLLRPSTNRRRLLILIERGMLGVSPELAIGHTVRVFGTARTVLGMQVTGEVPWPQELTRENIRRYDVDAVVLASSVQTADGVELIRPRTD